MQGTFRIHYHAFLLKRELNELENFEKAVNTVNEFEKISTNQCNVQSGIY